MKKLFFFVLLSIFLIPIVAFSDSQDTLNKSIAHIVSVQDESGAWSRLKGEFPFETEPTSWAVKVLAMNKVAPDKVEKGVNFILKDQKPDGSWNNNTAHTAFTILALKQVNKGDEAIRKGAEYLRAVQDTNGGFKRIGKEGAPLTIYTAVVLCALKEAGYNENDPMVKQAIGWLISCQNADGGYGMPKGAPSLSPSTAWTIKALLAFGTTPSAPSIQNAVNYLLKTQKPSGGFSPVPPAPEDPEATAYAIMALRGLQDKKDTIQKASDYLAKVQQADGAYISNSPVQFNKTPKKNTQTTAFVAWALSEGK
ncbi:MAG: terpene cyclase/mutase family protein [Proteobacteria bacterium]|nr:terpene cyclase/mutase family protein [Pseudomonadota bacterium]